VNNARGVKDTGLAQEELLAILQTVGREVRILQPPSGWDSATAGGRDIDCIAADIDPLWPLRLDNKWQLVQRLQYLFSRCQWWLLGPSGVVVIDTTEDPKGLETGLSTLSLIEGHDLMASGWARAAYLTEKRLFKNMLDHEAWREIAGLADQDQVAYRGALETMYGQKIGGLAASKGLLGQPPEPDLVAKARTARYVRRVLRPDRGLSYSAREGFRRLQRLLHPTGLFVLVVGPDGTGKSTFATSLVSDCSELFRRTDHYHWRPGVLPRLGTLSRNPTTDVTQPHARKPRGRLVSGLMLGYHWLDFAVGGWSKQLFSKARTGLVVVERGWWDIMVDPLRYRLTVPPAIVSGLGRLLPRPDVTFLLETAPDTIMARKNELGRDEIKRQVDSWRIAPDVLRIVRLDGSLPTKDLAEEGRRHVAEILERKTISRLGRGWATGVLGRGDRWSLPRGPRRVARSGLLAYHPMTFRGLCVWSAARALAGVGLSNLTVRGEAPPRRVREIVGPYLPVGGTLSSARGNHPGRYLVLLIASDGRITSVGKVATDPRGQESIEREAAILSELGGLLRDPLSAPRVIGAHGPLLLLEPVDWRPRVRPWRLPAEVASSLGAWSRLESVGLAHGDFAPWNLLRTDNGWVLIDWEQGHRGRASMDVFHYIVQGYALLGRPSRQEVIDGLQGRGRVGHALKAYFVAAGLDPGHMTEAFISYLHKSRQGLDHKRSDGVAGLRARDVLLRAFERQ
jgi:hypothetical protein